MCPYFFPLIFLRQNQNIKSLCDIHNYDFSQTTECVYLQLPQYLCKIKLYLLYLLQPHGYTFHAVYAVRRAIKSIFQ